MAGQRGKRRKVSVDQLRGEMENEVEEADEGCWGEANSVLGPGRVRMKKLAENFGMQTHSFSLGKAAIWATCLTGHCWRFILVRGTVQTTLHGPNHIITHRYKQF